MLENGDAVTIPVILGLVEIFKRLGMPSNWAPVASMALGLVSAFAYVQPGDPAKAILTGVVMGLSAMGLWSGPKTVARALRAK